MEKIIRNRKRFQHNRSREIIDVQIYDSNHRQETARQTNERKNIRTEKDDQADQTEHFREEQQEKHNSLISAKEKHVIKEEPIQRMERFGAPPNYRPTGIRPSSWTPAHNGNKLYQMREQRTL